MPVITIPFDYDPQEQRDSVVPIFLTDTDESGERICLEWIDAVVPVQDRLRALSRRVLGDVWRVSELTEITIHHLWHRYRDNVGFNPSHRVYCTARRKAHSLEDPGARVHLGLNLSLDALEEYRRDALVGSDASAEMMFGRSLNLRRLEKKLKEVGASQEFEVYRMLRAGYRWREIGRQLETKSNTAHRRFARLLRSIRSIV